MARRRAEDQPVSEMVMATGTSSGHPDGALANIQERLFLGAIITSILRRRSTWRRSDVEAIAFRLGENLAHIGGQGRLFLFQA